MTDDHPTRESLERFLLGQLPASEMRLVSRHLFTGCAECRRIAGDDWETEGGEAAGAREDCTGVLDAYDAVFDKVLQRVSLKEALIARERMAARELCEELTQHPTSRQLLLVSNSVRFRNPALCDLLLERSQEAAFQAEMTRSIDLARLAIVLAETLTEEGCGSAEVRNGLLMRAWAQLGNAHRLNGEHPEAEQAFEAANTFLGEDGQFGLLDAARVLDLEASLRRDQRRFDEAMDLLDRVVAIYQQLGQRSLLGRALKQKSLVCGEAGDLESEMDLLKQSLEHIDPVEEPRTFLSARHNLVIALYQSGRASEAFTLLFHTRPLYLKMGDRMTLLRLRWVEGMVACGMGRAEQAEVAFREVRDAFVELQLDYDAAVVSLDLAGVYVLQGRSADLRRLAEEMLAVFTSRNIPREAFGALLFFCEAAKLEKAEAAVVHEVSEFLKRARGNPDLRFTPTSW
ncbi:MAG TPA: tetratricopeptide repeat protein [Thermoanaerobaculia bacterium]